MTTAKRDELIALARSWRERKIDTDTFISRYWPLRRLLLDSNPELFAGRFARLSSDIDTALNVYSPEPSEPHELDETTLRRDLEPVVRELEELEAR
jgi:hypothetical protein